MRSVITGFIIVCIAASTGFCQLKETFDMFFVAGAGFGVGGRDVGPSTTETAPPQPALIEKKDHFLNFGSGLKIEGGVSYKLMDHLYGQAALCYSNGLWGINKKEENVGSEINAEKYSYSTFGIKALVKPMFQVLDLFDVYTNFGIGLYFAGLSIERKNTVVGIAEYNGRAEESHWPALAFIGSLGVEYPINPSVIVFGELHCEMMNFMIRQRKVTNSSFTDPNEEWRNGVYTYEKNATDRNTPYYTPGSNVAIRAGVRIPIF